MIRMGPRAGIGRLTGDRRTGEQERGRTGVGRTVMGQASYDLVCDINY